MENLSVSLSARIVHTPLVSRRLPHAEGSDLRGLFLYDYIVDFGPYVHSRITWLTRDRRTNPDCQRPRITEYPCRQWRSLCFVSVSTAVRYLVPDIRCAVAGAR
ncbi:hypothetical protein RSOLAG1IB_05951 [Rhizoctonia solani AG-1 IB]|uniref:Uncharacterized protein n=1 Tax=Thanatephorus cucumeris (strain AG1-IB / isolate 7/3/14) TaxID=1108050 RepID=A0A0B7F9J0_THACB|nr:hypothetical protein RSOLAG1IB_05951 [Rhizoctonia solani AG-1 IB]